MSTATLDAKTNTGPKNRLIYRDEALPEGWQWYSNGSVINDEGVIVYLTSGIRGAENLAEHILAVHAARQKSIAERKPSKKGRVITVQDGRIIKGAKS